MMSLQTWDHGIWDAYGLSENPYFIQPLADEALSLFRGESRARLARELTTHIRSGGSPLLLLQGGPGVGKTTLVNYAKDHVKQGDRYYVYPQPVEISTSSTRETLAAELLAAMTTTALIEEPDAAWREDHRWTEAYETIADTWKQSGLGGGIQFAGFGANLTRAQVTQLARVMPWETWRSLVGNILGAMLERRAGFVVHLNNIDAVSDDNPQVVRRLLDETRELFIQPGMATILCASPAFRSEVIADRQRLLDVITMLNPLEKLSPDEFLEAVQARYQAFSLEDARFTAPVEDQALAEVYQTFEGDMRNTFQVALTGVVQASLTQTQTTSLTEDDLLALSAAKLEAQYEQLVESEQAIVDYLLDHGTSPSQSTIREAVGMPQPTVSHASRRLENKRWIATHRDGTRKSYHLTGYGELLSRARTRQLV